MRWLLNVMRGGALAASLAGTAAFAAGPLEGSWGGADSGGRTAQVIIAGDQVIGVYWLDDYRDATKVRFSQGGGRLDFDLAGRKAWLVRAGAGARITVRDRAGREIAIDLKKD